MQIHLGETLPDSPLIVHAPPALLFTIHSTLQNPPGFTLLTHDLRSAITSHFPVAPSLNVDPEAPFSLDLVGE